MPRNLRRILKDKFQEVQFSLDQDNKILLQKKKFKKIKSVLIIDRNINLSNSIIILTLKKYRMIKDDNMNIALSGEQGLHHLKQFSFSEKNHFDYPLYIFIDWNIDDMDVVDFLELVNFCNFIRKGSVHIILITDLVDKKELLIRGFDHYLQISKPITEEKVIQVMENDISNNPEIIL